MLHVIVFALRYLYPQQLLNSCTGLVYTIYRKHRDRSTGGRRMTVRSSGGCQSVTGHIEAGLPTSASNWKKIAISAFSICRFNHDTRADSGRDRYTTARDRLINIFGFVICARESHYFTDSIADGVIGLYAPHSILLSHGYGGQTWYLAVKNQ